MFVGSHSAICGINGASGAAGRDAEEFWSQQLEAYLNEQKSRLGSDYVEARVIGDVLANFIIRESAATDPNHPPIKPLPPHLTPANEAAKAVLMKVLKERLRPQLECKLQIQETPRARALYGEKIADIKRQMSELFASLPLGGLSGVYYMSFQGEPLFEICSTRKVDQDRREGKPFDAHTQFHMCSMGKMFTSMAITQLITEGKLSLDDPVKDHLSEFQKKIVADRLRTTGLEWEKITIRDLLSHTAGLGNTFSKREYFGAVCPELFRNPPNPSDPIEKSTVSQLLRILDRGDEKGIRHQPGAFHYSNMGFILLGAVIEHESGMSYPAYAKRHIFDPAGMKDTTLTPLPEEKHPLLGIAHLRRSADTLVVGSDESLPYPDSSGGAVSTPYDMEKFMTAIDRGTLVPPEKHERFEVVKSALFTAPDVPDSHGYRLGFQSSELDGKKFIGHTGGMKSLAHVTWLGEAISLGTATPSTGTLVISIFTNTSPYPKGVVDISKELVHILAETK